MYGRFLILASGLASGVAGAADDGGSFRVKGAGFIPCARYVDAHRERDKEYVNFAGWIDGYVSAMNRYEKKTYDLAPWQSTELMAAAVAQRCSGNPEESFHKAVNEVINRIYLKRSTRQETPVEFRVGNNATLLYPSTIRAIERKLIATEMLSGTATGAIRPALIDAIKSFQASVGLEATGFPDQRTLVKLL